MMGDFPCRAVYEVEPRGVCRHPRVSVRGREHIGDTIAREVVLPLSGAEMADRICVAVEQVETVTLGAYPYGVGDAVADDTVKLVGGYSAVAGLEGFERFAIETLSPDSVAIQTKPFLSWVIPIT